jgi:hypothetical protein
MYRTVSALNTLVGRLRGERGRTHQSRTGEYSQGVLSQNPHEVMRTESNSKNAAPAATLPLKL